MRRDDRTAEGEPVPPCEARVYLGAEGGETGDRVYRDRRDGTIWVRSWGDWLHLSPEAAAARILGIERKTLYRKLDRMGL